MTIIGTDLKTTHSLARISQNSRAELEIYLYADSKCGFLGYMDRQR